MANFSGQYLKTLCWTSYHIYLPLTLNTCRIPNSQQNCFNILGTNYWYVYFYECSKLTYGIIIATGIFFVIKIKFIISRALFSKLEPKRNNIHQLMNPFVIHCCLTSDSLYWYIILGGPKLSIHWKVRQFYKIKG